MPYIWIRKCHTQTDYAILMNYVKKNHTQTRKSIHYIILDTNLFSIYLYISMSLKI